MTALLQHLNVDRSPMRSLFADAENPKEQGG